MAESRQIPPENEENTAAESIPEPSKKTLGGVLWGGLSGVLGVIGALVRGVIEIGLTKPWWYAAAGFFVAFVPAGLEAGNYIGQKLGQERDNSICTALGIAIGIPLIPFTVAGGALYGAFEIIQETATRCRKGLLAGYNEGLIAGLANGLVNPKKQQTAPPTQTPSAPSIRSTVGTTLTALEGTPDPAKVAAHTQAAAQQEKRYSTNLAADKMRAEKEPHGTPATPAPASEAPSSPSQGAQLRR